jgi:6-pyruvoyl-tetrahydropterin synthase-like protein
MWWHVWSNHPTSTSICGCGDTSLFTWFLEWPAYALAHGLNPLYSTAVGYPHGINLLANTGMVGIGVILAPITWMFGPIATLNVALTLGPALSGFTMFVLLRRWVSWEPAAFVGGLLYGFSPLILTSLDYSHLNFTTSPVPPLIVLCLDELVIRQRRRPIPTGVLLGLLVSLQFFLGTEILVIVLMAVAFGIAVLLVYAAWKKPQLLPDHARFAAVGIGAGAITAAVLLAYPTWFALAGPAHISGIIWPDPGQYVNHLKDYLLPAPAIPLGSSYGFDGPILSGQYLGIGLLVVLVGGVVAWRRDLRLWFFALVGVTALALSLGVANPLFSFLPVLENILPSRFDSIVYLAAAVMLGIVVDHTHASVNRWYAEARSRTRSRGGVGALGGLVVAGIALVPLGLYLSQNVPIPVQSLHVPSWFRTVAPHLGQRQVLLVFPDNVSGESPMTWQVIDGMRYSMVDEGGPGGDPTRAGSEETGQTVINNASLPASVTAPYGKGAVTITPPKIAAVRNALHEWGVTTVVIPDQRGLVPLEQIPSVTVAAALITAATGQLPVHQNGAWVWTAVDRASPSIVTTTAKFSECTSAGSQDAAAVDAAIACITTKGPFLRIVSSVNGTELTRNRVLMTTVADSVPVRRVEFVVAGNDIAGSLSVPAHRFVYGTLSGWVANSATTAMGLPNGTYTLRSVAYDATGTIGLSPAVTMRLVGATSPRVLPVTSVLKPTAQSQLNGSNYLAAAASSPLGVGNLEFRISGDGRTVTEKAARYYYGWLAGWNTRSVPNGTYTVYSVAQGNTGLTTTSKGVVVEVSN